MASNLIVIDTTVRSNITLPSPYSLGTYVTVMDNGSNPSFFASQSIRIATLPGSPFYGGSRYEYITVPKGALTFVAMTSNWRLVNTAAYVTSGNAVLSNVSTTNLFALSTANISNLTVEKSLTVTGGIDLQHAPTIQGIPSVNSGDMVSTVVGLGFFFLSSVPSMNASFVSTVEGLGTYGYISSTQLQSTVAGLGSRYVSTGGLTSTQQGLGTYYLSTPSLTSTVEGLGTLGYVSRLSLASTVEGLGSLYISTASLFSTVSNIFTTTSSNHRSTVSQLGFTYVSSLSLVSTVLGISTFYISPDQFTSTQSGLSVAYEGSIASTVTGLGNVGYISSLSLVSTVTSVQASNLSNVSRSLSTLSNYISSLSLYSTVDGLGTFGYISLSQLTSTTSNLTGINASDLASTVQGLGNFYFSSGQLASTTAGISNIAEARFVSTVLGLEYVSSTGLQSTVAGLGTFGYISLSQLTSTTLNLETSLSNSITSTIVGLGSLNYISIAQMISTVGGFSNVNESNLVSTVNGLGCNYISSTGLQSTVAGLGTYGYISLSQLTSTTLNVMAGGTEAVTSSITGLGSVNYISTAQMTSTVVGFSNVNQSNLVSTVNGLGCNYISSLSIQSTVAGLGTFGYISLAHMISTTSNLETSSSNTITSTIIGLGSVNYISTAQITSTVTGFSNVNQSNLVSTVKGLGCNYISSTGLQSTVAGLGTYGYISLSQLTSTTSNVEKAGTDAITSTIVGLGSFYISTAQITSTVTGFSNVNQSNLVSTVNTLGCNYISSLSLQSTVAGLGTFGYISLAHLISTTSNLVGGGTAAIASTVIGLGTSRYISVSQLTSTVTGFSNVNRSNLISTVNTLGFNSNYISTAGLQTAFTTLKSGFVLNTTVDSTYTTINGTDQTIKNSTLQGLGTLKYISLDQITSTVTGFSNVNRSNLVSTVTTLGSNYISSLSLQSTVTGIYALGYAALPDIVSTTTNLQTTSNGVPSTLIGLGSVNYISTAQIVSTVTNFSNTNGSNLVSTVNTLGSNFISSPSLQSTVAGLGTLGYISTAQLVSTTEGLSNPTTVPQSMVSSVNGLGAIIITDVSTLPFYTGVFYTAITYTPTLLIYSGDLGIDTYIYINNYAGTAETPIFSSNLSDLNIQGLASDGINVYASLFDVISFNQIISVSLASGISTRIASNYSFNIPRGICLDSTNTNLYVCDTGSGNLLKINLSLQSVTTVTNITDIRMIAIDPLNEYAYVTNNTINIYKVRLSDGNQTPITTSVYSRGISLHPTKYVAYVTSSVGTTVNTIYEVDLTTGGSTLLAGNGFAGYQDGLGLSASFQLPFDILYNRYDSSLYVADTYNRRIRRITLTTTAYISSLSLQASVANLGFSPYFYISTPSLVSTVNGLGTFGYLSTGYLVSTTSNLSNVSMTPFVSTTVGLGNTYISTSALKSITPDVYSVTTVTSSNYNVVSIAYTSNYIFYTAEANNNILYRNSFFGNAQTAFFTSNIPMYAITCDLSNVYATFNNQIIRVNPSGVHTVIANTGNASGYVDGTNPANVSFSVPVGLALDSTYTYLYVCDYFNDSLRRIQLNPFSVTTVATIPAPVSVSVDSQYAYVTSATTLNVYKVYLLQSNVTILASFPSATYGISIDRSQTFAYVTSIYLHKIYTLNLTTGSNTPIAGSTQGYLDGNGTSAKFDNTYRIAYNTYDSCIYVADNVNGYIRKISTAVYTSTIAGLTSSERVQRITASNSSLYAPATSNFVTSAFQPLPVSAPVLWLDGADPYGTGIIPATGTAITLWTDKTGRYPGTGMREGSSPYASYSNGIRFSSPNLNGFLTPLPGRMSNQTVFTVFNMPASSATKTLVGVNSASPSNAIQLVVNNNLMQVELAFSSSSNLVVQTFAGSFSFPSQLAVDGSGNIFVAVYGNNVIQKITPGGLVSIYAGSTTGASGYLDANGSNARFTTPIGVAVDSSGIVYVADTGNYRIRRIDTSSNVTTICGNSTKGLVNGQGVSAQFDTINHITVHSSGNIYVCENSCNVIRRIDSSSNVTTFAGTRSAGSANGIGTVATFTNPVGVACDSSGNVYVADSGNNKIRKITPLSGVQTGTYTISYPMVYNNSKIYTLNPADTNYIISINLPAWTFNSNQWTISGHISPAPQFQSLCVFSNSYIIMGFNQPGTLYVFRTTISSPDSSERLFFVSSSTTQDIVFVACNSNGLFIMTAKGIGDGGVSISYMAAGDIVTNPIPPQHPYSTFYQDVSKYFSAITCDNTYVYVYESSRINKILISNPTLQLFATVGSGGYPSMVADFQGNVYFSDGTANLRIVTSDGSVGIVYTFPNNIYRLAIDLDTGVVYASSVTNIIYKYSPPVVSTVAGSGVAGSADGSGLSATFFSPSGVTVDSSGILYVTDVGNALLSNNKIRKIDTSSNVTTFAGSTRGSSDGLALSAQFNSPNSVAIYSGIIYVSEFSRIRYTTYLSNTVIGSNTIVANTNTLFTSVVQVGAYNGVNGYLNGAQTLQGSIFDGFTGTGPVNIGITYNPAGFYQNAYDGSIQEVIVYNTALSTTDRQSVEAYLRAKWLPSYAGKCNTTTQAITLQNMSTIVSGNLYATNITAATFTAQSGRLNGSPNYGFYYGNGQYVTTISDRRLKEDIHPIQNALEKVSSMQAVRYRLYRDPSQQFIGYVAQDLEVILPEVVRTDSAGWKSIQYTNLPGLIIEAVKELKEKYDRVKLLLSTSTSI